MSRLALRDRNADGNSSTGSYGQSGLGLEERLYYLNDVNSNVTALVSASGSMLERYVYDGYGNCTVFDPAWSSPPRGSASYDNHVLFAGYWQDSETGFYQVRNRYYQPRLGSWLQRDPVGYKDGMDLYEYVKSDPEDAIDPMGEGSSIFGSSGYTFNPRADVDTCGGGPVTPPIKKPCCNFYPLDTAFIMNSPYAQPNCEGRCPNPNPQKQPTTQPPLLPPGTDCGIRVKRSPLCSLKSLGHTWIEWGNPDAQGYVPEPQVAEFPWYWTQGVHKCEQKFVQKQWSTKINRKKRYANCDEVTKCLRDAQSEWDERDADGNLVRGFNILTRNCRVFADYALKKCGLDKKLDLYDRKMKGKYCNDPCGKMGDGAVTPPPGYN